MSLCLLVCPSLYPKTTTWYISVPLPTSLSVALSLCVSDCLPVSVYVNDAGSPEDDDDSFDRDEAALLKEITDLPKNVGVRKVPPRTSLKKKLEYYHGMRYSLEHYYCSSSSIVAVALHQ